MLPSSERILDAIGDALHAQQVVVSPLAGTAAALEAVG
jgi:hypothetical protein